MRTKLACPIFIFVAIISSCLIIGCDSEESPGTTGTPAGGEPSQVSTQQLDFATKAVNSSLAAIPEGVVQSLGRADVSEASAMQLPDILSGAGLLEDELIYEGDGITITSEGFSTDPPGLILGFAFDEFTPVEDGEETISGKFTLLACLDISLLDQKIKMILNTDQGAPLVVSGGPLDGTTLGFENFTLYYSLSQGSIDPVGVEGTLLINGTPVDLGMLEGLLPLPQGGASQEVVSQEALQVAVQTLLSSMNGNTLIDLPDLIEGGVGDLPLPGLPEDGVVYEGDGITVTFEGFSMDPPGLILGFAFDEFTPVEDGEETISGKFTLLACLDISLLDQKIKMILNTDKGAPLFVNGGQLDGTTLGFENFTLYYSLSQGSIDPVGAEGTLLINGIPVDLDMFGDMLRGV